MRNIYYNPEDYGLEIIESLADEDLSYEFDIFLIFRDKKSKKLYYAQDSGCSCPSPFEDYGKIDDLSKLNITSLPKFKSEFTDWCKGYDWRGSPKIKVTDRQRVIRRVERLLDSTQRKVKAK